MKLPRFHVVTLGVRDLDRSTHFYEAIFGISPNPDNEGISFFELPGTWLSLFPLEKLAEDISADVPRIRSGFSGVTTAFVAGTKEEVLKIFEHVETAERKLRNLRRMRSGAASAVTSPIWPVISGKLSGVPRSRRAPTEPSPSDNPDRHVPRTDSS